jgi:predicted TIM-barrel fold metal-dependent hydrolase
MIVDCHCHAGKGDIMTAPWNTAAPLGKYLRRAKAAGIARTVVFPAFHSNYRVANRELAKVVRAHRGRLIGFACVRPRQDRGRVRRMLEVAVRRYGFRGLKVHGHMGFATREVCETVRDLRVPMLFDVAGRAEVVDMLAPEFPTVDFIIPHLGSFADDWRAQQRVVEQLVRYPNVYADTSGVRRFDYIVEAVRRAGPGKLLFGSDGPWLHPGVEMAKIRALGLPRAEERLVLGGNIVRLLRKGRRAPRPVTLQVR